MRENYSQLFNRTEICTNVKQEPTEKLLGIKHMFFSIKQNFFQRFYLKQVIFFIFFNPVLISSVLSYQNLYYGQFKAVL